MVYKVCPINYGLIIQGCQKTWINLEFDKLKKNLEILTALTCSVVKLRFDTKNVSYRYKFFVIINFFFIKKHIQSSFTLSSFQCLKHFILLIQ